MASFIIEGGHPLRGTIRPQGAKNEALQVICATLLTSEAVTIHNIPNIRDVNNLIQLLRDIGVKVSRSEECGAKGDNTYTFQADTLNLAYLESDQFVQKCAALRGSVMLIGPLLARMGKAIITKPGGDKIGRRRLDTHFPTRHPLSWISETRSKIPSHRGSRCLRDSSHPSERYLYAA